MTFMSIYVSVFSLNNSNEKGKLIVFYRRKKNNEANGNNPESATYFTRFVMYTRFFSKPKSEKKLLFLFYNL